MCWMKKDAKDAIKSCWQILNIFRIPLILIQIKKDAKDTMKPRAHP